MYRSLYLFGIFFLIFANTARAQEPAPAPRPDGESRGAFPSGELPPGFRERALVMDINARVVEQNQLVTWDETHQRLTIPGRPVGLKLVGANVAVAVQFTPYLRRGGRHVLVAQGQIWVDVPNRGVSYQTTMQTIPLEFDEPIYFFPLGSAGRGDTAHIEIMLTMKPYRDAVPPEKDSGAAAALPEDSR